MKTKVVINLYTPNTVRPGRELKLGSEKYLCEHYIEAGLVAREYYSSSEFEDLKSLFVGHAGVAMLHLKSKKNLLRFLSEIIVEKTHDDYDIQLNTISSEITGLDLRPV